jgi:hypothetical protein
LYGVFQGIPEKAHSVIWSAPPSYVAQKKLSRVFIRPIDLKDPHRPPRLKRGKNGLIGFDRPHIRPIPISEKLNEEPLSIAVTHQGIELSYLDKPLSKYKYLGVPNRLGRSCR